MAGLYKAGSSLLDIAKSGKAKAAGLFAALQSEDAEAGVITKGGKRLIESWHGTPHSFDKFDISKLGSGEGAQAYGHGLYTADAKGTAEGYRDALRDMTLDGREFGSGYSDGFEGLDNLAVLALRARNGDIDEAIKYADSNIRKEIGDQLRGMDRTRLSAAEGSLYKVHIDATPEEMLDWDKPLSEQPQVMDKLKQGTEFWNPVNAAEMDTYTKNKDRLDVLMEKGELDTPEWDRLVNENRGIRERNDIHPSMTGEDLYRKLAAENQSMNLGKPSPQEATSSLDMLGIKGIQYNDAMSRGIDGGSGTKNYVTFDDKLMNIVERGSADPRLLAGIAGAGAIGTGAATLYTPEQNQAYADQLAKMGIYEHTDTIKPEANPGLYSIGAALDRIETPLDPLMGRGWATSGISKYLKDFGERKGGSLESLYDSAGAVMDVM